MTPRWLASDHRRRATPAGPVSAPPRWPPGIAPVAKLPLRVLLGAFGVNRQEFAVIRYV
jgi:hypothetical protein